MSDTAKVTETEGLVRGPQEQLAGVLARAKAMYAAIVAAVASFPNPTIAMAVFLALIQALDAAQDATASRAKGLATMRNTKRNAVWTAMESLRAYVKGSPTP